MMIKYYKCKLLRREHLEHFFVVSYYHLVSCVYVCNETTKITQLETTWDENNDFNDWYLAEAMLLNPNGNTPSHNFIFYHVIVSLLPIIFYSCSHLCRERRCLHPTFVCIFCYRENYEITYAKRQTKCLWQTLQDKLAMVFVWILNKIHGKKCCSTCARFISSPSLRK